MIAAWFSSAWGWLTKNPVAQWIIAIGAAIIGYETLKWKLQQDGARNERLKNSVRQAETKAAVTVRVNEMTNEEKDLADAAIAARDAPVDYPTADSMPDPLRRTVIRP